MAAGKGGGGGGEQDTDRERAVTAAAEGAEENHVSRFMETADERGTLWHRRAQVEKATPRLHAGHDEEHCVLGAKVGGAVLDRRRRFGWSCLVATFLASMDRIQERHDATGRREMERAPPGSVLGPGPCSTERGRPVRRGCLDTRSSARWRRRLGASSRRESGVGRRPRPRERRLGAPGSCADGAMTTCGGGGGAAAGGGGLGALAVDEASGSRAAWLG